MKKIKCMECGEELEYIDGIAQKHIFEIGNKEVVVCKKCVEKMQKKIHNIEWKKVIKKLLDSKEKEKLRGYIILGAVIFNFILFSIGIFNYIIFWGILILCGIEAFTIKKHIKVRRGIREISYGVLLFLARYIPIVPFALEENISLSQAVIRCSSLLGSLHKDCNFINFLNIAIIIISLVLVIRGGYKIYKKQLKEIINPNFKSKDVKN